MTQKHVLSFVLILFIASIPLSGFSEDDHQATSEFVVPAVPEGGHSQNGGEEMVTPKADGDEADEQNKPVHSNEAAEPPKAVEMSPAAQEPHDVAHEEKASEPAASPAPPVSSASPAPSTRPSGVVQLINQKKKFIVIEFSDPHQVPSAGSQMGIYRNKTFIGVVRITDPIKPPYAAADILSGTVQIGDTIQ